MASTFSKLTNIIKPCTFSTSFIASQNLTKSYESFSIQRSYFVKRKHQSPRNNLFARISPLGDPDISLAPVLDKWVEEGKNVKQPELQRIIRDLRSRKRYNHSLEVSTSISSTDSFECFMKND